MRFQDVRLKGLGTGLLGAGLLGLVLGTCGTVKAQDARDDAKPQQEEPKQDEAKPAQPKPDKDMKPGQEQPAPKAEEGKPAAKNDKMDKQDEKRNSEMKPAQEQNRPMQNNNNDRAMQNGGDHAKPAGQQGGQRIPDDKFRANFGRQHTFRVQTQVVQGQPRFQYGGYWFALANPWPGDWAYTDDCYVDYIDGEYVLIDLLHPGVEIPLVVVVE
ncbi:MAG: hypothetical protein WBM24_24800 [Candidatus Sulfotelmatobacter sp.]